MQELTVEVQERNEVGKNLRRLRRQKLIPAIVYGGKKAPQPITVDPNLLLRILHSEAGANSIFQLSLKGTDRRRHVMIKDYQVDPVNGDLLHVDLLREIDWDDDAGLGSHCFVARLCRLKIFM